MKTDTTQETDSLSFLLVTNAVKTVKAVAIEDFEGAAILQQELINIVNVHLNLMNLIKPINMNDMVKDTLNIHSELMLDLRANEQFMKSITQ